MKCFKMISNKWKTEIKKYTAIAGAITVTVYGYLFTFSMKMDAAAEEISVPLGEMEIFYDDTYAISLTSTVISDEWLDGEEDWEDDEYLLSDSDSCFLTEDDLDGLSPQFLNYARNEIFARYGRLFNSEELQGYFDMQSWYEGVYEPDEFPSEILNEYEKANVNTLKALEEELLPGGYQLDQPGKRCSLSTL